MSRPVAAVIFDLDGTLVQTRAASWELFRRVSDRFGLGVHSPEQYYDLFQGNVFASIRALCRDDAQAREVSAAFLQLLRDEYTPPMVPGMVEVVRRLAADCTLAVMSSNAMQVLRRVLVANEVALCFGHVFGGDVMADKQSAIRAFLSDTAAAYGRRCAPDYDETARGARPDPATTVLVTDTAGDVRDALAVGIRVIGVAWGMHSADELVAAGAEFVALWPQEVASHLLGARAAEPVGGACALPACGCADPLPANGQSTAPPVATAAHGRPTTPGHGLAAVPNGPPSSAGACRACDCGHSASGASPNQAQGAIEPRPAINDGPSAPGHGPNAADGPPAAGVEALFGKGFPSSAAAAVRRKRRQSAVAWVATPAGPDAELLAAIVRICP